MILNFSQECYYLKNKVGVVDLTKARGLVKFQLIEANSYSVIQRRLDEMEQSPHFR